MTESKDFSERKVKQEDCWDVIYEQCAFDDSDLSGLDISNKMFKYCSFNRADMTNIKAHATIFKDCTFRKAKLNNADLTATSFVDNYMEGADIKGVNWHGASVGTTTPPKGVYVINDIVYDAVNDCMINWYGSELEAFERYVNHVVQQDEEYYKAVIKFFKTMRGLNK